MGREMMIDRSIHMVELDKRERERESKREERERDRDTLGPFISFKLRDSISLS